MWRMNWLLCVRTDRSQVTELVDAGGMSVRPGNLQGVVADEPGIGELGRLSDAGRQDGERDCAWRWRLRGLAAGRPGAARRAWAVFPEVGKRIVAGMAVGPFDVEAIPSIDAQVNRPVLVFVRWRRRAWLRLV